MNPTPKRQAVKGFLTPDIRDFVLQQIEKCETKVFPEVGSKHPDREKYPDHRFSHAKVADDQGLLYTFFYVAPRADQEGYNWEYAVADIGGTKFDSISAVYATPRSMFTPDLPLMGTAAPVFSGSTTPDGYVLAQRKQSRVNDRALDGHLVFETQVYVRKVSTSEVRVDGATGRPKRSSTELFFLGEDVEGTPIEQLVNDLSDDYWGQQENGEYRDLRQLSDNWFAVETSNVLPEDSVNSAINPAKTRKVNRVTPLDTDVIFSEIGSMPSPEPEYGDDHYNAPRWPDHKLGLIEPVGDSGLLFKFTYVADRDSQDDYNWEATGDGVTRTYVVPRDKYFARPEGHASLIPGEFTYPPVTTADVRFVDFGFVDDSCTRTKDPELDSLYVFVRRRYIEPITTEITYNSQFRTNMKVTREIVAHTEPVSPPTPVSGKQIEVKHGNMFHNVKITQQLVDSAGVALSYPYTLSSTPGYASYRFPPKLSSANVVVRWAVAWSTGAPSSYSDDYYFDWEITEARPGPYKSTVKRIITDNPNTDALADTAITIVPAPKRETIAITSWWWYASQQGNRTSARAKQVVVPPTLHEEIDVTGYFPSESTIPSTTEKGSAEHHRIESLPATPGATAFFNLTEAVIGYQTRDMPFGLFEVSITTIDINDLYGTG
tara:strand:+ start:2675 stop:4654 length:1980 start_codon:yes stop_codon:yes gene_type:complete